MSTDCSNSSSTQATGTCADRSGPTRSRSSGSYPCAIAAAKRTRSRVWGSRWSCFAIDIDLAARRRRHQIRATVTETTAEVVPRPILRRESCVGVGSRASGGLGYVVAMPWPTRRSQRGRAAGAVVRALGVATILASRGTLARAQASPFLALDDPRLPLLEHLIARGDIPDPSPMMRPFRRVDAARALAAADSTISGTSRGLIAAL